MEQIAGLHHIGVYTDDMEASLAFYLDVLGFEKLFVVDDTANSGEIIGMVAKGGLRIELVKPEGPHCGAAQAAMASRNHIALACRDVASCHQKLLERGISCETGAPQFVSGFGIPPTDISILFFRGPSGELIELYEEHV